MSKLPNTPPSLKAWEDGWCEISLTGQKFTLIQQLPVFCAQRLTASSTKSSGANI